MASTDPSRYTSSSGAGFAGAGAYGGAAYGAGEMSQYPASHGPTSHGAPSVMSSSHYPESEGYGAGAGAMSGSSGYGGGQSARLAKQQEAARGYQPHQGQGQYSVANPNEADEDVVVHRDAGRAEIPPTYDSIPADR